MAATCPHCEAQVLEDQISEGWTRCYQCDSAFHIHGAPLRLRARVELPDRFRLVITDDLLQITYRWRFGGYLLSLAVVVLVFWNLASDWRGGRGDFSPETRLFLSLVVGGSLVAAGILALVNRTRVTVSADLVEVKHRPVPISPDQKIENDQLEQLFCRGRRWRRGMVYTVYARISGATKKERKLVPWLDEDEALFIEQEIEMKLGIIDELFPEESE